MYRDSVLSPQKFRSAPHLRHSVPSSRFGSDGPLGPVHETPDWLLSHPLRSQIGCWPPPDSSSDAALHRPIRSIHPAIATATPPPKMPALPNIRSSHCEPNTASEPRTTAPLPDSDTGSSFHSI